LNEVPENPFCVDSKAICACFDPIYLHCPGGGVDGSPVLVRGGVQDVVLEVNGVLGEDSEGLECAIGERDLSFEGSTIRGGDVVWGVFGDGVIKLGIPGWRSVFQSVLTESLKACGGGASVKEIELLEVTVSV
jgi:hypothetical protein